ncbi:hypothetical protein VP01_3341g1 [Puccinia sorghi]|uniref:Zn(2)-C6 fungal-type domain-containing protein n=1 Tax=Puccinia sorghi TaxID=27349 RepID=A0A0L6UXY1_9BASI|nr:hypothetical protein VP01_3341g1 [Puccinia sorghi]
MICRSEPEVRRVTTTLTMCPVECVRCAGFLQQSHPVACTKPHPGAACTECSRTHHQCSFRPRGTRPSLSCGSRPSNSPRGNYIKTWSRKQTCREDSFVVPDSKLVSIDSNSSMPSPPRPCRDSCQQPLPQSTAWAQMLPKPKQCNYATTTKWKAALFAWALRHRVNPWLPLHHPTLLHHHRHPPLLLLHWLHPLPHHPCHLLSPIPIPLPTPPPPPPSTPLPHIEIPSPPPSIRVYHRRTPSPRPVLSVPATPNPPLLESPYQRMIPDDELKLGLPETELHSFLEHHERSLALHPTDEMISLVRWASETTSGFLHPESDLHQSRL